MFELLLVVFTVVLLITMIIISEKKINKNKMPFSENILKKIKEK